MDLEVLETDNGGDIVKGVKDFSIINGFQNMAYLALFGGNPNHPTPIKREDNTQYFDWWGNGLLFSNDPNIQFNSLTEQALISVSMTSSGAAIIENSVKSDLSFMNEFADIKVSVTIVSDDKLEIEVFINQPNNEKNKSIIFVWDSTKKELPSSIKRPIKFPEAPSGMLATRMTFLDIDLQWVSSEVSFTIERSTDNINWIEIATVSDVNYSDSIQSVGETYYYRVKANGTVDSGYSNVDSVTTLSDIIVLDPITNLTYNTIDLSWTDTEGFATIFAIERSIDNINFVEVATTGLTTYADTGLNSDTDYYYRVRVKEGGVNSDYSNVETETTWFSLEFNTIHAGVEVFTITFGTVGIEEKVIEFENGYTETITNTNLISIDPITAGLNGTLQKVILATPDKSKINILSFFEGFYNQFTTATGIIDISSIINTDKDLTLLIEGISITDLIHNDPSNLNLSSTRVLNTSISTLNLLPINNNGDYNTEALHIESNNSLTTINFSAVNNQQLFLNKNVFIENNANLTAINNLENIIINGGGFISKYNNYTSLNFNPLSKINGDFSVRGNNIIGALDLSIAELKVALLQFTDNLLLTSIIVPNTTEIVGTGFSIGFTGMTNLDLSNIALLETTTFFYTGSCPNLLSISLPDNSKLGGGQSSMSDCPLLETINFGNNSEIFVNLRLQNLPILNSLIFNTSTITTGVFDIKDTGLSGVLDLSNVTINCAELNIKDNPSITNYLFNNVGLITKSLSMTNCDIGFIDISAIYDIDNNISGSFLSMSFNNLTAAEVNQWLVHIDSNTTIGKTSGSIHIDGTNAAPDNSSGGFDGVAAVASLVSKGRTVITS